MTAGLNQFVSKRAVPIPGTDVELNRTGQFFAGVAVGVGIFITVRFGTRVASKLFSRAGYTFVKSWMTRKFLSNLTTGPLPGFPEPLNAPGRAGILIPANILLWVTGVWNEIFELGGRGGKLAMEGVGSVLSDIPTQIGNAAVSLGLGTRVDDDGGPVVVMSMPSGTASVVVGAAWRTDP